MMTHTSESSRPRVLYINRKGICTLPIPGTRTLTPKTLHTKVRVSESTGMGRGNILGTCANPQDSRRSDAIVTIFQIYLYRNRNSVYSSYTTADLQKTVHHPLPAVTVARQNAITKVRRYYRFTTWISQDMQLETRIVLVPVPIFLPISAFLTEIVFAMGPRRWNETIIRVMHGIRRSEAMC